MCDIIQIELVKHKMERKKVYFIIPCLVLACMFLLTSPRATINQTPGLLAKSSTSHGLIIQSPNSSVSWIVGTIHKIEWFVVSGNYSSPVSIFLIYYSTPTKISDAPNTGTYLWMIPSNLTATTNEYSIFVGIPNAAGHYYWNNAYYYFSGISDAFSITTAQSSSSTPGYPVGAVLIGLGIGIVAMLGIALKRFRLNA